MTKYAKFHVEVLVGNKPKSILFNNFCVLKLWIKPSLSNEDVMAICVCILIPNSNLRYPFVMQPWTVTWHIFYA